MPSRRRNEAVAGRRRALIICNGTFQNGTFPVLEGVNPDYEAARRTFGGPEAGFEVTALLDRGLLEVRLAIAKACRDSARDDTLLLYHSCYSFTGPDGSLYLPVVDSDREYPQATAIESEFILSQLRESACRHVLLLIDDCYSGGFFRNNRGIPDGLVAITGCAADEQTADTPQGGAFTRAVMEALSSPKSDLNGDGRIDTDELHHSVRKQNEGAAYTPQKWIWNVRDPIYVTEAPVKIFLSYCREDAELAKTLRAKLEEKRVSVWLDLEQITVGNWKERVTSGLRSSRALVLLMTDASLAAQAVKKELDFAMKIGAPIVPVIVDGSPPTKLPDWFLLEFDDIHRHTISLERGDGLDALLTGTRNAGSGNPRASA